MTLQVSATCTIRVPRIPPACLLALALATFIGCGRGIATVPVSGKITLNGGAWPKSGKILFLPVSTAPGMPARPTSARFDQEGHFQAQSFKDSAGLIPGRYKISVECWEVPPQTDSSAGTKSYVPAKYRSERTSGLELNVDPSQRNIKVTLDVKTTS